MNDHYDVSDPIVFEVLRARTALIHLKPLLAEVALDMDIVILNDAKWCPRAATDGLRIYFNRNFVISLFYDAGNRETRTNGHLRLIAVLAHEIWHKLWGHLVRRGNRDIRYWGMAIDYVVNATIKEEKTGLLPEMALLDPMFTSNHTAEEIYEYLVQNNVPYTESLDDHIEPDGCGDIAAQDIDTVMKETAEAIANGTGKTEGSITVQEGNERPAPLTEKEARQAASRSRMTLIRAVQEGSAGSVPAGLLREVNDVFDTKLDWRAIIDASLRSIQPFDYSYDELSEMTWASWLYHKRHWTPGCGYNKGYCAILPSQTEDERVDVVVALDTSASMSAALISQFLCEIGNILETFRDVKVHLLCFDAKVMSEEIFTRDSMGDFSTFKRKKVVGGGGTNFTCVFSYLKSKGIVPHQLIFCTDGMPMIGTWGDSAYCETIFAIHNTKTIIAPFGKTVQLK